MFVVLVTAIVLPGRLAEFAAAIDRNRRATLADEPGCLRFDVLQDRDDPLRFTFYEVYVDDDAFFTAHRAAAHYGPWAAAAQKFLLDRSNTYWCPYGHLLPEDPGRGTPAPA